jgi:hypothetical protein
LAESQVPERLSNAHWGTGINAPKLAMKLCLHLSDRNERNEVDCYLSEMQFCHCMQVQGEDLQPTEPESRNVAGTPKRIKMPHVTEVSATSRAKPASARMKK